MSWLILMEAIMARISKEKQEEIRKMIKESAKTRFDELGFEKTSTKEIAKDVGIAEGTLFNYFDSKTELFFEVFGDSYQNFLSENTDEIKIGENIGEILLSKFQGLFGFILKIPRGIMGELTIATVRMAKKHPDRFRKLAQYDFMFMDKITEYVKRLIDAKIMEPVDKKQFSEIIFSIIAFELLMYIYDHNIKKETLYKNINMKIDILVKGYVKGGN